MPALPGSLALTSIADGSNIVAADHRNNYAAVQSAVNALITALSGGSAGALLQALSSSSIGFLPDAPADGNGLLWDAASSSWKPGFGIKRLADSTLGAPAASFDFTALPAIFAHLLIVFQGRGDTAATNVGVIGRFNNDTAANYASQHMQGNAATASAAEVVSSASPIIGGIAAATATASHAGGFAAIVPAYAGTTFFKQAVAFTGFSQALTTTNIFAALRQMVWASTAAINRVTLLPSAGNFVTGSRCTIYGLG